MTEQHDEDVSVEPEAVEPSAPVATGHPAVDEVLRSLDDLDGRPVDEHVAAFEQAHDRLRRALSDAADDEAAQPED
ncbi:hypothetical protein ACVW00_002069 [Marmoricola sp. URHA0025 HA25]